MGGGQSTPSSSQHNGVDIHTTSGAYSVNTYDHISSGGGNTSQTSKATGSTTGVTADVTAPIPALMNLYDMGLMNLEASTTMYMVKDDVCNEVEIHDSFTAAAQAHGLVAGSCAHNGWTVKGKTFTKDVQVGAHVFHLPVTQWSHAGLMNLCSGGGPASEGGCNQMGMVILLI